MDFILTFDNRITSVESVQKALYRFSNRLDFEIKIIGTNIEVNFNALDLQTDTRLLAIEIKQSVNDYSLREKIGVETADMRNLILAAAFSRIIEQNNHDDQPIQ